jgi:hypothetical protein
MTFGRGGFNSHRGRDSIKIITVSLNLMEIMLYSSNQSCHTTTYQPLLCQSLRDVAVYIFQALLLGYLAIGTD